MEPRQRRLPPGRLHRCAYPELSGLHHQADARHIANT